MGEIAIALDYLTVSRRHGDRPPNDLQKFRDQTGSYICAASAKAGVNCTRMTREGGYRHYAGRIAEDEAQIITTLEPWLIEADAFGERHRRHRLTTDSSAALLVIAGLLARHRWAGSKAPDQRRVAGRLCRRSWAWGQIFLRLGSAGPGLEASRHHYRISRGLRQAIHRRKC